MQRLQGSHNRIKGGISPGFGMTTALYWGCSAAKRRNILVAGRCSEARSLPLLTLDAYECLDSLKVLGQADNH